MSGEKHLTTKDYWNERYKDQRRPKKGILRQIMRSSMLHPALLSMRLFFRRNLPLDRRGILEIGCALGSWLVFFDQEFGYDVWGIDYSEVGCQLARENLDSYGIEGEIICGDFNDTSFQETYHESFDIVYSLGLIEHFRDPSDVIKLHLNLLRKGGVLLLTLPNFGDGTLRRKWTKYIQHKEEELLNTHNINLMKVANLKELLGQFENLDIRVLGYFGPLQIPLNIRYFESLLNLIIGYPTLFLKSEGFSAWVGLVAIKH